MYVVLIDTVVIAVFIFLGLAAGAEITDILINIVKNHQTALIIFMGLVVVGINITSFMEVRNRLKKIIYIMLNTFLDFIIQF